jgi:predicted transcriptional regulator
MAGMKGITIKLPDATLDRLKREARASGRSVATLVRAAVEARHGGASAERSVHDVTAVLAGTLAGSRRSATNDRRRFRRS